MKELTTKQWMLGFASASLLLMGSAAYASETGDAIRDYENPENAAVVNVLADAADTLMDGSDQAPGPLADQGVRDIDGVGPTIDSTAATIIGTPNSGGGEDPTAPVIAAATAIAAGCATDTAADTCEPAVQSAIAGLTGDTPPAPSGTSALVDTVAVTVTGTVNNSLSCSVTTSDTDFDFGAIDADGTTASSDPVAFSVTCSNETVATNIYLSTAGTDPQAGTGSNTLTATYNDGTNNTAVNLTVLTDDNGDQSTGTAIGGTSPDYTSAGDQSATAVALFAQLDTTQITSGSGGTLSGSGNITVWVD